MFWGFEKFAWNFALAQPKTNIFLNKALGISDPLEEAKGNDNKIEEEMAQGPKIILSSPFPYLRMKMRKRG